MLYERSTIVNPSLLEAIEVQSTLFMFLQDSDLGFVDNLSYSISSFKMEQQVTLIILKHDEDDADMFPSSFAVQTSPALCV